MLQWTSLFGKPKGEAKDDGEVGSRHERRGGAMMRLRKALAPQVRRADYSLARMSGMLDLSKDENATCPLELQRRRKHFLPRWLIDVARG